jgi:hypothetical protein
MLFQLVDDGRALQVTAQTAAEVREVIEHCKLDPFSCVEAFSSGTLVHKLQAWKRDDARWFEVNCLKGPEWLEPYMGWLRDKLGYTGPIPEIDPAPRYNRYAKNLCHTHIVTRAKLSPLGHWALGYICAGDWNGKTAAQRAVINFEDYVEEGLGDRYHEPEYIGVSRDGSGLLKKNPDYTKWHAPKPAFKNDAIFEALVRWWLDNAARPAQKQALQEAFNNYVTKVSKRGRLGEWLMREHGGVYRHYEAGGHITWQQLKELA